LAFIEKQDVNFKILSIEQTTRNLMNLLGKFDTDSIVLLTEISCKFQGRKPLKIVPISHVHISKTQLKISIKKLLHKKPWKIENYFDFHRIFRMKNFKKCSMENNN
jgi:hypothetical protein